MGVFLDLLADLFGIQYWITNATNIEKMVYIFVCVEVLYHCLPLFKKVYYWFYKAYKTGYVRFFKGGRK